MAREARDMMPAALLALLMFIGLGLFARRVEHGSAVFDPAVRPSVAK
jgi:hypothetical protein